MGGAAGVGPSLVEVVAPQSADEVRARMARVASVALPSDLTPDQARQIDAILDQAAPRAFDQVQGRVELRERFRAALLADRIDREELEALRGEAIERFDSGSLMLVDVTADLAEALTVDQRQAIAERVDRWLGRSPPADAADHDG